jgi:hypothetical protein
MCKGGPLRRRRQLERAFAQVLEIDCSVMWLFLHMFLRRVTRANHIRDGRSSDLHRAQDIYA